MDDQLNTVQEGHDAIVFFSKEMSRIRQKEGKIKGEPTRQFIYLTPSQFAMADSAKSLNKGQTDDQGNYVIVLTSADINKANGEWHSFAKGGTKALLRSQRKRGTSTSRSPFNDPRTLNQEFVEFLQGAAPLADLVPSLGSLAQSTSSRAIVTSLMSLYVYGTTTVGHSPLKYFSTTNIASIKNWLQNHASGAALDNDERQVVDLFLSNQGPQGFSDSVVQSALAKYGLGDDTRIAGKSTPKVINGTLLGADQYMASRLRNIFASAGVRDIYDFKSTDLTRMNTKAAVNTGVKLSVADNDLYKAIVLPYYNQFNEAANAAKKEISKASPKSQQKQVERQQTVAALYSIAAQSVIDYNPLLQAVVGRGGSDELQRRVVLDSEQQNVKLHSLRHAAAAKHRVQV